MEKIQKILDTMTVEKWKKFFGLIEWNFGEADEIAVRKSIDNLSRYFAALAGVALQLNLRKTIFFLLKISYIQFSHYYLNLSQKKNHLHY